MPLISASYFVRNGPHSGQITYKSPFSYSASLKFSFKFRISDPDVSDGLLMYAAQSGDGQGDFASVAIKDQHLEFRFDTGSGKINSEVGRRVWHYETLSSEVNMEEESQPKI